MDDGIFILIIIGGIILQSLFLYVIIRWAMQIKRQIWNQRQQITLLLKIAVQLGVSENDELTKIKDQNGNPIDQYLN